MTPDVENNNLDHEERRSGTAVGNIDKNVIGDLISSAINNRKESSNQLVDCTIYDENEMVMHLPHPSDCNKFFKCQGGRPVGKRESTNIS